MVADFPGGFDSLLDARSMTIHEIIRQSLFFFLS
jgi:hypothetical protein